MKRCLIDLGLVQNIVRHINHHNINQREKGCPHVWLKLQGISFAESILITLKYRFAVAKKTDPFQSLIFPTEGNFCKAAHPVKRPRVRCTNCIDFTGLIVSLLFFKLCTPTVKGMFLWSARVLFPSKFDGIQLNPWDLHSPPPLLPGFYALSPRLPLSN